MTKIAWKWNIPNVLSLVRLALIPVIMVTYLQSENNPTMLYIAIATLLLSGVTDSLDGIIARHFNQITEVGKILDPIADKATQIAVAVCLSIRFPVVIPLLVICVVKETAQAVGSVIMLRKGAKVQGAVWFGKVATFLFYGAMAGVLAFPQMPSNWRLVLVTVVSVAMLIAFIGYLLMFLKHYRDLDGQEKQ